MLMGGSTVMQPGLNPSRAQQLDKRVPVLLSSHREYVVDAGCCGALPQQDEVIRKSFTQPLSVLATRRVPSIKVRQLDAEHRCLQSVETLVVADHEMLALAGPAEVRGPTTLAAESGSISPVSRCTSQNTGKAPACRTPSTEAMKVCAGTTTSSPGPIPAAIRARAIAAVPEPTPTQWEASEYAANSRSNASTSLPRTKASVLTTRSKVDRNSAASGAC